MPALLPPIVGPFAEWSASLEATLTHASWSPPLGGGVALLCVLILTPLVIRLAYRRNWLAYPTEDRWHQQPTALMGGVSIYVAVLVALFAAGTLTRLSSAVWAGAALLLVAGLVDDLWELDPGPKLIVQVAATMLALYGGYMFWPGGPAWCSIPLTFLWVIGITNAFNLIDGMDGLAAGIAAIAAGVLAAIAELVGDVELASVALAITGAAGGFLAYNFKPARIFMGDGGSMFLGYMLAMLALAVQAESGTAARPAALLVPVLVLAVPIFDTVLVTTLRAFSGRPLTQGAMDHAMYQLTFLGLSEERTVLTFYGLSGLLGSTALVFYLANAHLFYAVVLFAVVALAIFGTHLGRTGSYAPPADGRQRALTEKLGALFQTIIGPYWKTTVGIVSDLLLVAASFLLAHALRFEDGLSPPHESLLLQVLPTLMGLKVLVFYLARLYHGIWRHAGTPELVRIIWASFGASTLAFVGLSLIYGFGTFSATVFLLDALITTGAVAATRFGFRGLRQYLAAQRRCGRRVLLYGADRTGVLALRHLRQSQEAAWHPVGFLDDDPRQKGRTLQGLSVIGTLDDLPDACQQHHVESVIVTRLHLPEPHLEEIARTCREAEVSCHRFELSLRPAPAADTLSSEPAPAARGEHEG